MTNIKCNSRIEYTKGDTLNLTVSADAQIDSATKLKLIIAKNETSDAIIDTSYSMNSDGDFFLFFSEENKKNLLIGDYIYKMILIGIDGSIITQKSGDFIVKWGA